LPACIFFLFEKALFIACDNVNVPCPLAATDAASTTTKTQQNLSLKVNIKEGTLFIKQSFRKIT
jgi:hypothetical protein